MEVNGRVLFGIDLAGDAAPLLTGIQGEHVGGVDGGDSGVGNGPAGVSGGAISCSGCRCGV
jgi:hypothetical protein